MSWWSYKPYLSVAQRRLNAAGEVEKLRKKGRDITPVLIDGRKIATTFWGKAWCDNLESYSDFANRLPRGRSYVKNGSVCDLQVGPGRVHALVCGTQLYHITIKVGPLAAETWAAIKRQCAGQIGSLIELLQGKLSKAVMEVVTRRDGGLFPKPREIDLDCSCPDWADMCKHVAAALYGVGARLDHQPELLFTLRQVDHLELITEAGAATAAAGRRQGQGSRRIAAADLGDVFGVDLEPQAPPDGTAGTPPQSELSPQSAPLPPPARKATPAPRGGNTKRTKSKSRERPEAEKPSIKVARPKSARRAKA